MARYSTATLLRISTIILWIILVAALLRRDYFIEALDLREARVVRQGREESFMGVYFREERIGYVKSRLYPLGPETLALSQEAFLRLNILDENHPIRMHVNAELTSGMLLKNFTFRLRSPFYEMDAKGEVRGREVRFQMSTGKETIDDTIALASPPYLSTNQRAYLLSQNLQAGDRRRVPYFDPLTLSGQNTVVHYHGTEKVLLRGRVHRLHHFTESYAGLKFSSWLNDEGKLIKEESPAGFTFISEPEFKATDIVNKGREILSTVSVPVTGTMPPLQGLTRLSYTLTLPEDSQFTLHDARQSLDGNILTVTIENMPSDEAPACGGPAETLASTPYIQAKNNAINALAQELTATAPTPMSRVRILAEWVYENLEKRPVLGIPDALTTLNNRMGDCNEHAALFAALARNVGIPTRIAAGVVFHQGAFYYHAWNEVCVGESWISLDTTRNELPADITHIKFTDGEVEEMVKIGALLGNLAIEVADDPQPDAPAPPNRHQQ